jgi:hypothetical protein
MNHSFAAQHSTQPQWATGSRLLKRGETIEFHFYLPNGITAGNLTIFPRYLELAQPGNDFEPGGRLSWLGDLPAETIELAFIDGRVSTNYTPTKAGNYLARWRAGEALLYRYFSVIEDDWTVLRFSTFSFLESEPTLHGTGIPLDYRLAAAQFDPDDPLFQKLLDYHRHYGDNLVPVLPDMPPSYPAAPEQRTNLYSFLLAKARSALPFPNDIRSARVEMNHEVDPGYTEVLAQLGINDHCGLQEANAKPWLGMPEFPYFSSLTDCRKANQDASGPVVAHQWDFCGGWHFLGPVSWHYKVSEGDWSLTEECLHEGLEELENLTAFSNHPAFATPLYDGILDLKYPNPHFQCILDESDADCEADQDRAMSRFVRRYQYFMAFDAPKKYKVVYARSIDIADYYRRHFPVTPRTIFVSKTDHVMYDMWWLCHWGNDRILVPRERIPAATRISSLMSQRRASRYFKDPLSYEYILVEDQYRSIRFERECLNPIWWFDYTQQQPSPRGSTISHTETPDVEVLPSAWAHTDQGLMRTLKIVTQATFPNYAIALWDLPAEFCADAANIQTNAKDCVMVWNRDGECHLVLFFDLKPDLQLQVSVALTKPPN